jgi:hypothetical protein
MRANVINPSLDRRLGNGHQAQRCKEPSNVPEADAAYHREGAGQPDNAVAHMLGCRDALDLRSEVPPLVIAIQIGTLRDDEPVQNRMVERREFMHSDVVGFLAPTDRRGGPQRTLQVEFSQIERHNRRAVCDRRADKGVLGHLRDRRLKLHLHRKSHPTP